MLFVQLCKNYVSTLTLIMQADFGSISPFFVRFFFSSYCQKGEGRKIGNKQTEYFSGSPVSQQKCIFYLFSVCFL